MQIHRNLPAPPARTRPHQLAFTLVEIIGVVALIAVLAAVLAPRVTSVMARGKIAATAESLAGLKSAVTDYLAVKSSLPIRYGSGNTNAATTFGRFDADLVAGGFLDHLFSCPIGNQTFDDSNLARRIHVRCLAGHKESEVPEPDTTSGGDDFDIDRDASTLDTPESVRIVSAFIPQVREEDAIALNKLIDGDVNKVGAYDIVGRCIYGRASAEGTVTVYVYITHL